MKPDKNMEPPVEIPAREVWLFKNKDSLAKVKRGLSQKSAEKRGSFAKHSKDAILYAKPLKEG